MQDTEIPTNIAVMLETDIPSTEPSSTRVFACRCAWYFTMLCAYLLCTVGYTALELRIQVAVVGPDAFGLQLFIAVCAKIVITVKSIRAADSRDFGTEHFNGISNPYVAATLSGVAMYCTAWLVISTIVNSK